MNKEAAKYLDSLSHKERQNFLKGVQELREKFERREKSKRRIIENDNYILWLIKFTKEHPRFATDDWLYTPSLISKEDNENVTDLGLLFDIIEEYADKNFIPLFPTEWGGYYLIQYNGIGFNIEVASGQGTIFGVERLDEVTPQFIDFKLIQKNVDLESTEEIRSKFVALNEQIKELSKKVPVTVIRKELSNTLNELIQQKMGSENE